MLVQNILFTFVLSFGLSDEKLKKMKPTTKQIEQSLKGLDFNAAIEYISTTLKGERQPMGLDVIGRFYVDGANFYSIMFYKDFDGKATKPTYTFNN